MKRKVDSKGRVVLSLKDVREILLAKEGDIVIASPKESEIKRILRILERYEEGRKKKAIEEWFKIIEEVGLSEMSETQIQKLVKQNLLKEIA